MYGNSNNGRQPPSGFNGPGFAPPQAAGYPPQQRPNYNGGYAPQQGYGGNNGVNNGYSMPPQQGYGMNNGVNNGYSMPPQQGYGVNNGANNGYSMPPQQGYGMNNGVNNGYSMPPQQAYGVNNGYSMPPQQGYGGVPPQQYRPQEPQRPPQNPGFTNDPMGYRKPQPPQPVPGPEMRQQKPLKMKLDFKVNPTMVLQAVVCGVIPLLFVLAMLLPGVPVLKWVFAGAAAATLLIIWLKKLMNHNSRLTTSVVYGALILVAVVSVLTSTPANDASRTAGGVTPAGSQQQSYANEPDTSLLFSGVSDDPDGGYYMQDVPSPTKQTGVDVQGAAMTTTDDLDSNPAVIQLKSFFWFWSVNGIDEMLSVCSPSWVRSQGSNANAALFQLLSQRTPLDYKVEKISGTENDIARTVTVTATISKASGLSTGRYRLAVLMTKEDGNWYVDPRSLSSSEPELTATPSPAPTASPTPSTSGSTKLYYNPSGGTKYHADPNCSLVGEKYRPLKGQFTYAQVNDPEYASLRACNVCNAPLREN